MHMETSDIQTKSQHKHTVNSVVPMNVDNRRRGSALLTIHKLCQFI